MDTPSGVDMSYNGPPVPLYRPPSGGAVPYKSWKDEAPCTLVSPSLFELQDFEEVERGKQEESIAEGLKICSGCPVRAACLKDSSELDRYWTTRGGQPPEGLFPDGEEPRYLFPVTINGFRPGGGPERPPGKVCKRGHDDWVQRPGGKRRCRTCQRMSNKSDWEKRKAKSATLES